MYKNMFLFVYFVYSSWTR